MIATISTILVCAILFYVFSKKPFYNYFKKKYKLYNESEIIHAAKLAKSQPLDKLVNSILSNLRKSK